MAIDRAPAPHAAGDLTLSGLLDVLDRAEALPPRHRARPSRAVVLRPGAGRRATGALPPARPVPVPVPRPRPATVAAVASQVAVPAAVGAAAPPRPGLRDRIRGLVRRLSLWGAGPGGANLAWGGRSTTPAAPAPRADGPVVLTELPNTPTIQPAAPSPAAALPPVRVARPAAPPRVPVVAPLARQSPAPRPAPAPATARRGRPAGTARASAPARSRGDPRPPPARGQPPG